MSGPVDGFSEDKASFELGGTEPPWSLVIEESKLGFDDSCNRRSLCSSSCRFQISIGLKIGRCFGLIVPFEGGVPDFRGSTAAAYTSGGGFS